MNPVNESSINLEAGSASMLNVSLDVSGIGKKATQCPGVPLPVGLQPSSTPVVRLILAFYFTLNSSLANRW